MQDVHTLIGQKDDVNVGSLPALKFRFCLDALDERKPGGGRSFIEVGPPTIVHVWSRLNLDVSRQTLPNRPRVRKYISRHLRACSSNGGNSATTAAAIADIVRNPLTALNGHRPIEFPDQQKAVTSIVVFDHLGLGKRPTVAQGTQCLASWIS